MTKSKIDPWISFSGVQTQQKSNVHFLEILITLILHTCSRSQIHVQLDTSKYFNFILKTKCIVRIHKMM